MTAVVVVSFNSSDWLFSCISRLLMGGQPAESIIVADNASSDGSADAVAREFPGVRLIRSEINRGYSGGANLGLRANDCDYVVIMNPDVAVRPTTISALVNALDADPQAAIAGGKLLLPGGKTIQHAGGTISYPLALGSHIGYRERDHGQHDQPREAEYVTGALFAVRRSALAEIGFFDEGFYPAYFEEVDLCRRARDAGYRVLYVPESVAIHHELATTGRYTLSHYHFLHRNRLRYVLKHYLDEQFFNDFLPAEVGQLVQAASRAELVALRQAYADAVVMLEEGASLFANPSDVAPLPNSESRRAALALLADEAAALIDGTDAMSNAPRKRGRLLVGEPRFASPTAVFGPAIDSIRRLWDRFSTRWYVRDLIGQQNAIYWRLGARLQTVERRAARLGESHSRAEVDVAQLTKRVDELEAALAASLRGNTLAAGSSTPNVGRTVEQRANGEVS